MKKQLFTWVFILAGLSVFAASPSGINQYDTVYFDLLHASVNGTYFELPVFIKSDDVVNSLDFAMKFDLAKLQYDSLIIHNTDMSPLANYNTNDSTLRLTAFSVPTIPNGTTLVTLRFKLLSVPPIKKADFTSLTSLLNGDACTAIILIEQDVATAIVDPANNEKSDLKVYPNPAHAVLNIETPQDAVIQIIDMEGRVVMAEKQVKSNQPKSISTTGFANGNYIVKATSGNSVSMKKIEVVKP